MACEVHAQRGRRRVVRKMQFPFTASERTAAMQSLREWMEAGRKASTISAFRHRSQEWVLGVVEVRYLLLPWTPDLADKTLMSTFAAALFEQQFKQDPALYAIQFARSAYGCAQLAAFVPHALLAEIDTHARASRIRVRSVAPALASVWDRFHAVLQKERGVVHVIDGDRQIIVHHVQGRMHDVLLRPFDADHRDASPPAREVDDRSRFFASGSLGPAPLGAALSLPDGDGFFATEDRAYAFALCGVL
jgi:hypothetical protein